ncbi:glutathione peroxidase [Breznakia blatticola]|uniref:Glutathione peroxidase n=1 Tax=Breznakia blatticola TaxID=1754012 RepID=A0A4V3G6A8_9FIRM|nr:glutathione peroxidase [Breznakia blatticola]TDW13177.1 glutathione peroxidase [Breznakia blatticola]
MKFYDFTVLDNKGNEVALETYKGKTVLVVNTATKCGLTPQYEALEALYKKYKDKGFVILDFPSNQFLEQAPGTDEEIDSFCTLTYNTTFPRFKKIDVNGEHTDPLFKWLKEEKPEADGEGVVEFFKKAFGRQPVTGEITWNFEKFLIDKDGNVVKRFTPATKPEQLEEEVEELL